MGEHSAELQPVDTGGYWFVDPQRPDVERWHNGSQVTELWRWRASVVVAPREPSQGEQVGQMIHVVIAWIACLVTLGYFLPWAVAASRSMPNAGAIAALNLLLGWTVVGWIIALVMACAQRRAA